jgi:SAM-dependent methyltransferase
MSDPHETANEQTALWNGPSGRAWVESQQLLDQVLQPFEDILVDAVRARRPRRVLDVGCGTGATTLATARLLGADGHCTGIDISEPMLAVARARAERGRIPADFIQADAQVYPLEPAGFDLFISRFGVMFFADPVQAFANLRRAAAPDAQLRFIAWRSATENPFMTAAERAAAPFLPNLPPRRPDAPGQFAFANAERVHAILAGGGWHAIDIRPIDVACTFPEKELAHYLTRLGPVGGVLQDADEPTRRHVLDAIRPAFDPFVRGAEVRFTGACWMIEATG